MRAPDPVVVGELFPEILEELLALLRSLDGDQWQRATACPGWSVHDVALHLLGGDAGILSRQRDGYRPQEAAVASWGELVAFIDAHNEQWITATRRLSPRLVVDLLAFTGPQVTGYFLSRDPLAPGAPVSWAGAGPAPVWLDLAREYTERWLHQQHIREAVGAPLLDQPHYLAPVLATFVHALPVAYEATAAPDGTAVVLTISGAAGGEWALRREGAEWRLYQGRSAGAAATITLAADTAWRLFTRGISSGDARERATVMGDIDLARPLFSAVAILA
jgi:uncharacterized protein (TIGR03083 family)